LQLTIIDNQGATASGMVVILVADSRLGNNLNSNSIEVYPNPVRGMAIIAINTTQPDPNLLVMIKNVNGGIIYKKPITSLETQVKQPINLSNFPKRPDHTQ
jgi:hypothetical protein